MEQAPPCEPIAGGSAIVLTGGKSSRMGRPKALLPFDGAPLILHIVRALKLVFAEIVLVAAPEQELPDLPAKLVRDEVPYQGPVGGIYYGLKATTGEFSFVTSCDVAFINLALISYLTSGISGYDVVVPYWNERFQPLHAVYRKGVLPLLKEQLDRGDLRPVFLYDKVRTNRVDEAAIREFDPEGLSFFNMNSPEDYQLAVARWQEIRSGVPVSISVTVELFGVARLLAKTNVISLSLPRDATLVQALWVLAERLPVLVGRVISPDKQSLSTGYACNINGLDFVRNPNTRIHTGDRIFIVAADAGG